MTPSVIIVIANTPYLPHVRSFLTNCRRQGNWQGDFALICPQGTDLSSITGRGIDILIAPEAAWSWNIKFRVFSPHFRQWHRVLYIDLDSLVQGDLNAACDREAARFPAILAEGSQHTPDPDAGTTILEDLEHFDRLAGGDPSQHLEVYQRIRERFPFIDEHLYSSSVMLFDPASIPDDTVEQLLALECDLHEINPSNNDQDIINLLLRDRLAALSKDFACWFAFGDPGNLVASEARGWTGSENPAILHYWGSFSPWLEKTPDAGAYFNHRLGKPCREVYLENLKAFEGEFPS